jgi:nitrite reductase/ring-hydroxylating ferredoxin subunit
MSEPIIHLNEFRVSDVPPGKMLQRMVGETYVCVYNVGGTFYATQDECAHAGGPLHEGELDGVRITCPWHGACYDVTTGAVLKPPAKRGLKLFRVTIDDDIGRVDEPPQAT